MRRVAPSITVFAIVIAGALLTTSGAAAHAAVSGTCLASDDPELPCSASEGQGYDGYTVPAGGQDTESSVEGVLKYVLSEETDVSPVEVNLTGDTADIDFSFPDGSDEASFGWSYSGDATLAFLTVQTGQGAFAIYDITKQTHGSIDFGPELGTYGNDTHFGFWQRTFTDCEPVKVTDTHGPGIVPGCQLAEIVKHRVPCVHVTKEKSSTCVFKTGKHPSGKWLEGKEAGNPAIYALGPQPLTKRGKPNGPWVVASKQEKDGGMPCRREASDPGTRKAIRQAQAKAERTAKALKAGAVLPARDTASYASDGSLSGSGYTEIATSTTNVNQVHLANYATKVVWTSEPPPHPDGAQLVAQDSRGFGFSYGGAAMNDMNGVERYAPAYGSVYIDDPYHRHFITYNGSTVAAAKRPPTKPNGQPLPGPIAWRTVNPNISVAN